ncbi:hypothetical protein M413DRAFT_310084 [Hebeloma cylindrosporum]|uniref:Zn(2)-C6 fungal-type domain-containing protein n=1 Tax=Hebeloma cylindrosporum TaxID=76867 RepID=A0A0C2YZ76_HEBCY|nr:hypothetical protein M413DRAFT_310084 [Hebeloma cylindrosporum h7]
MESPTLTLWIWQSASNLSATCTLYLLRKGNPDPNRDLVCNPDILLFGGLECIKTDDVWLASSVIQPQNVSSNNMSLPTKANPPPKDVRRVPMACTNCRQKKLRCRKQDEMQRECVRCIQGGIPCEFLPVNPSPNASHNDPQTFLQPPQLGFPSPSPTGRIHSGYYPTQPNNLPLTAPNPNIDPSLMPGPQGVVPNPGNYPSSRPFFHPIGPSNPSSVVPSAPLPPQSHGHQGSYHPNPGPQWMDHSHQYGNPQATSAMGQVPYPTQYGTWPNPQVPTVYYQHSRPSDDQR